MQPLTYSNQNNGSLSTTDRELSPIERARDYVISKYQLHKNVLTGQIECHNADGEIIEMTEDRKNALLFEMLAKGHKVSKGALDIIINNVNHYKEFNPIEDFFNGLPAWDGVDHIAELSKTVTVENLQPNIADTTVLFPQYLHRWLISTVATALDRSKPKKVNQWCFTFYGLGGKFKTRWWSKFVVPEMENLYYRGKIAIHNNSEITIHLLTTKILIIIDDQLQTLSKTDYDKLKTIIDGEKFETRKVWAQYFSQCPRTASFVGLTDTEDFLTDQNNRRFLIFTVKHIDINHTVNMHQVWAQALHCFKQGQQYWFDDSDTQLLNQLNQVYRKITTEEDLLLTHFRPATGTDADTDKKFMQTGEIMKVLQSHTKEILKLGNISDALKNRAHGFEYTQKWINSNLKSRYGYYVVENKL